MKRQLVKNKLDEQVKELAVYRERAKKEQHDYGKAVLETDKRDQLIEKQKQDEIKRKAIEAKLIREQMVKDSQLRKEKELKAQKDHERKMVAKLQEELQKEKQDAMKKKELEREQAKKVIEDNFQDKLKRHQTL